MPTHAGPNTASESNIVFSYDIGDTSNSYRGEPTTNMWGIESGTNVNNRSSWSMPYAYNGAITDSVYSLGTWNGNRIWEVLHTAGTSGYAGFESWRLCVNQPTAGNTIYNTTRRVAIKICILEGSITDLALHSGGGNSGHDGSNWTPIPESQVPRDCPRKTGWYQFLADGSWASNSVGHCVGLAFISYNRVRILTTEPMYYPSDHLIPFTGYQRSATQGLLPLINNPTINLSSVSFDSNAQIIWDGTDDTISINSYPAIELVDNVSIEYVYMRLSTDPVLDVIANKYHNTGWELFCQTGATFALAGRNGDGTYYATTNPAYTIQNNQYYHLVAIKDGFSWRLYVNGQLYSYLTAGTIGTWSNSGILQIGGEGSGYYPHMKLPIFKIYNTALSADQVQQNYRQYKSRFNLS